MSITKTNDMNLAKEKYYEEGASTTLAEVKELANELLNTRFDIGIYRGQIPYTVTLALAGWTFEFNTRKRSVGRCNSTVKTIQISTWFLEQNLDKGTEWENTLRHELAHAIDCEMRGKSDHGRVWQAIAREVLCTAERCADGLTTTDKPSKYTLTCPNCGEETASHKKKRSNSACSICCNKYNFGKFSPKYIVVQTQNY